MSQANLPGPTSVFLVSGGARGITAQCVIRLAQQYRCTFILLGRSPVESDPVWAVGSTDETELKKRIVEDLKARGEKPTPLGVQKVYNTITANREIEHTLQAVRQAGSTVEYASVDVTNSAALLRITEAAAQRLGPITGIIHGAGTLADKRIENKTERDFETVYAVKVHGLENLLNCVPLNQLKHLILFSSVAGFYGNIGQADYAIANEILNKAAYLVKSYVPECRVISVNWGPWDAGMVTPELKTYFEQHGIKVIPVETGTQMLLEELESGSPEDVQVVIGSPLHIVGELHSNDLRTSRIHRTLVLDESPMLGDHVVNSQAVLPMVCAMSWMANACEQLYPGYRFFGYTNYKVLKGIVFDDSLADDYVLELKEVSKGEANGQIIFDAIVSSQTPQGKARFHYSARIELRRELPPAPRFVQLDLTHSADIPGEQVYEEKILFHGWSFQGVERVLNVSPQRTTMRCKLPTVSEQYQGQFPIQSFNYFGVDAALQSLGIFARLTYDMGSLPLSAQGGKTYRNIPFGEVFYVTLEPRTITEATVIGDLTIHDEIGQVYFVVEGCEIALSKRLIELFHRNTLAGEVH